MRYSFAACVVLITLTNLAQSQDNPQAAKVKFNELKNSMDAMLARPFAEFLKSQARDGLSVGVQSECKVTSARLLSPTTAIVAVTGKYQLKNSGITYDYKLIFLVHLHYYDDQWSAGSYECSWDKGKEGNFNKLVLTFMDSVNE